MQRLLYCGILLSFALTAEAQPDARTFQNFFRDGSHVGGFYGDAGLNYADFDGANVLDVGAQLGFRLGRAFELGVDLVYISVDREFGDNLNGLSDIGVTGRYLISSDNNTDISVGGGLTLPVGDEDVGQGDVDVRVFGALRHATNPTLAITGVFGIEFLEQGDDYDYSLRLAGGLVWQTDPDLQFLAELNFLTDMDSALLTFGADYRLNGGNRLRPAFGIGVDDGSPDLVLLARFFFR
ncbi:MAG: hypothetical protein AAF564_09515 [Bacteroidota bacterium]